MSTFHLSYDRKNEKIDSNELLKDIVTFLMNEFNATRIERPVESTLIFYLDNNIDFNNMQNDFLKKFQKKIYFVLSRISYIDKKYMYFEEKNALLDVNFHLDLRDWEFKY